MYISPAELDSLARLMSLFAEDYQEAEVRRRVGEEVLRLLKADYLASYVWDGTSRKFDGRVSINMDDANLNSYEQYYQFHDPITYQLQALREPTLVSQVMPQPELVKTEFFNDFLKKDGLHYGLNVFAYDGDLNIGDLRVWRSVRRNNFDRNSVELMAMIQPAFTRALIRARRKDKKVIASAKTIIPALDARLSAREREIASKMLQGLSDKEIALSLNIEFCTVRTHVAHIFGKLGARNRSQVVAALLGQGISCA